MSDSIWTRQATHDDIVATSLSAVPLVMGGSFAVNAFNGASPSPAFLALSVGAGLLAGGITFLIGKFGQDDVASHSTPDTAKKTQPSVLGDMIRDVMLIGVDRGETKPTDPNNASNRADKAIKNTKNNMDSLALRIAGCAVAGGVLMGAAVMAFDQFENNAKTGLNSIKIEYSR